MMILYYERKRETRKKESEMKTNKMADIARELEEKHLTPTEAKEMAEVQMKFDFRRSMPKIRHYFF